MLVSLQGSFAVPQSTLNNKLIRVAHFTPCGNTAFGGTPSPTHPRLATRSPCTSCRLRTFYCSGKQQKSQATSNNVAQSARCGSFATWGARGSSRTTTRDNRPSRHPRVCRKAHQRRKVIDWPQGLPIRARQRATYSQDQQTSGPHSGSTERVRERGEQMKRRSDRKGG